MDDICVDGMAKVTISTNQSHSHGDAITLFVNGSVCSSTSNANDVVRCRELNDVVGHTLSYNITAIDAGTVTIRGQTSYYGATWYSNLETITIVEECDEGRLLYNKYKGQNKCGFHGFFLKLQIFSLNF